MFDWLKTIYSSVLLAVTVVFVALVLFSAVSEVLGPTATIEQVAVAPGLQEVGYTPDLVTKLIVQQFQVLQREPLEYAEQSPLGDLAEQIAQASETDIDLPGSEISARTFGRELAGLYRKPLVVGGSLLDDWSLRIWLSGGQVLATERRPNDVRAVAREAALVLLEELDPCRASFYAPDEVRAEQAIVRCLQGAKSDSDRRHAYTVWGRVRHRRGDYADALEKYRWASDYEARGGERSVLLQIYWGDAHGARKELEAALERYAEAERLDRDGRYRFLVQMNRGVMRYGRLEYADAVRHYEAALAATTAPRDRAIVDLNWGNCLRDQADSRATPADRCADLRHAIKHYRESLDLQPRDSRALAGLGTVLHRLGRRSEAERSLRLAIQVDPAFLDSYVNLASVLLDLGRPAEAEQIVRAAIERAPDSSDAWSLLGQALMDQERFREAIGAARRARELLPESVHATIAYARALREAGRPREALEALGEIASRHADMERGKARCALRQKAEAERSFRGAVDDPSTRTYAEDALEMLRAPSACRSATPRWDAQSRLAQRSARECDSSAR